jgi:hypothetical protein
MRVRPFSAAESWSETMADVIFLALGTAFFLAAIAYTIACDRL